MSVGRLLVLEQEQRGFSVKESAGVEIKKTGSLS